MNNIHTIAQRHETYLTENPSLQNRVIRTPNQRKVFFIFNGYQWVYVHSLPISCFKRRFKSIYYSVTFHYSYRTELIHNKNNELRRSYKEKHGF